MGKKQKPIVQGVIVKLRDVNDLEGTLIGLFDPTDLEALVRSVERYGAFTGEDFVKGGAFGQYVIDGDLAYFEVCVDGERV